MKKKILYSIIAVVVICAIAVSCKYQQKSTDNSESSPKTEDVSKNKSENLPSGENSSEENESDNSPSSENITEEQETESGTKHITEVTVEEVEERAAQESDGITKIEAEELCYSAIGDQDDMTGFPISYYCIGAVEADEKLYYVMHREWLVDNSHWSYIGNCYVSSDGKEIYDGVVTPEGYEITELLWKK